MLLDKYRSKNVKLLISSDSGASSSISTASGFAKENVASSMVVVIGNFKDFDDDYIEVENCKVLRVPVFADYTSKTYTALEEFSSTLINRGKIITISLTDE